jgi:hypothetical protein
MQRVILLAALVCMLASLASCGGDKKGGHVSDPGHGSAGAPTAAQLTEAKRLLNPENTSAQPPSDKDVDCVARIVVQNPTVDQIANDMAQIPNKDLRQLVMTDYLHCAYNFVLDLYMRFAPAGMSAAELSCIRAKFTELNINTLSEVMVEDPDAGQTGPLLMHACETGASANPLQNGLPSGGGS